MYLLGGIQLFHKIIQSYKEVNGKYFTNLLKVINKTNFYSKSDDTFLNSVYQIYSLISTNIETQNIKTIKRPIRDLKQNIKLDFETDFWKKNSFYIEDNDFKFE